MARVSFTLRKAAVPAEAGGTDIGSVLRFEPGMYVVGGASAAASVSLVDYDSALRADGLQLAPEVSPFVDELFLEATAVGYGTTLVSWSAPIDPEPAGPTPTLRGVVIVYSPLGEPETLASGEVLYEGNQPVGSFPHEPPPGEWAYYSLFAHYQSDAGDDYYEILASVSELVPRNYSSNIMLWNRIPEYYRRLDVDQGNPPIPADDVIGTLHGANIGPLFRYLSVLGFEIDRMRTAIDYSMVSRDPQIADSQTLDALSWQLGVGIWTGDVGAARLRSLLNDIGFLRRAKGTAESLALYMRALTGCDIHVDMDSHEIIVYSQRVNYVPSPKTGGVLEHRAAHVSETTIPQEFDDPDAIPYEDNYDYTSPTFTLDDNVDGYNHALVRVKAPANVDPGSTWYGSVQTSGNAIKWGRFYADGLVYEDRWYQSASTPVGGGKVLWAYDRWVRLTSHNVSTVWESTNGTSWPGVTTGTLPGSPWFGVGVLSMDTDPDNPDDIYLLGLATRGNPADPMSLNSFGIYVIRRLGGPAAEWETVGGVVQLQDSALPSFIPPLQAGGVGSNGFLSLESGGTGKFTARFIRTDGTSRLVYGSIATATGALTVTANDESGFFLPGSYARPDTWMASSGGSTFVMSGSLSASWNGVHTIPLDSWTLVPDMWAKRTLYVDGAFRSVNNSGVPVSATSPGGTWNPVSSPPSGSVRELAYRDGRYVAVGTGGAFYSDDWDTWTEMISSEDMSVSGIDFSIDFSGDQLLINHATEGTRIYSFGPVPVDTNVATGEIAPPTYMDGNAFFPMTTAASATVAYDGVEFLLDLRQGPVEFREVMLEREYIGDYFDGDYTKGGWLVGSPSVSDYRWAGTANASPSLYTEDYERMRRLADQMLPTIMPITHVDDWSVIRYNGIRGVHPAP